MKSSQGRVGTADNDINAIKKHGHDPTRLCHQ